MYRYTYSIRYTRIHLTNTSTSEHNYCRGLAGSTDLIVSRSKFNLLSENPWRPIIVLLFCMPHLQLYPSSTSCAVSRMRAYSVCTSVCSCVVTHHYVQEVYQHDFSANGGYSKPTSTFPLLVGHLAHIYWTATVVPRWQWPNHPASLWNVKWFMHCLKLGDFEFVVGHSRVPVNSVHQSPGYSRYHLERPRLSQLNPTIT